MRRTLFGFVCAGACFLFSGVAVHGQQESEVVPEASRAALVERLAKSMVKVRYFQRFDKGQPPPNAESIRLEYPHEEPGFLLENGIVCTEDIMIHERFIDRIEVGFGDAVVGARIVSYAVEQDGMLLRLEGSLAGAEPLVFDADADGPCFQRRM